jgi:hypothetical protein
MTGESILKGNLGGKGLCLHWQSHRLLLLQLGMTGELWDVLGRM